MFLQVVYNIIAIMCLACRKKESHISLCVDMVWSRDEFQQWLSDNKWYIVGGVILAAGGVTVGYLCPGGVIKLIGECGALKVAGCLAGATLAGYVVAKVPLEINAEYTPGGAFKVRIFTGDAARDRAKQC